MFILFGTKDRAVETDSGNFHCPNCNLKEEYGKKYNKINTEGTIVIKRVLILFFPYFLKINNLL